MNIDLTITIRVAAADVFDATDRLLAALPLMRPGIDHLNPIRLHSNIRLVDEEIDVAVTT